MTEQWRAICRGFILGALGINGPLYLYGDVKKARAAVDVLTVGRSLLYPEERMYCGNWALDEMYAGGGKDANGGRLCDYSTVVINEAKWRIFGKFDRERRLYEDLFDTAWGCGSRILIGPRVSPADLEYLSEQTRDRIMCGTAYCVDGEMIDKPLEEIAAAGIALPGKKGRFAELYRPEYLQLFSCEPTEELREEQWHALERIYRYVRKRTDEDIDRFREISRIQREDPFLWSAEPEDLPADFIEFRIIYQFWNRFSNGQGDRDDVRMAKSGALGRYLRALKMRDEPD